MNISPENMDDPNRDRFVLSKGHSVEAYYAVLAAKGFFPIEEVIANFSKFGSKYIGHPNNKLPGIEMNSGSLGHGLPVSIGMALAGKMDKRDYRVYTVMGDGELAEGQPRAPDERPHKADNKGNQRWQHKDGPVAFYGFFHRKAPFSDSLSCFVSLEKAGRAISARPTGIAL